MEKQSRRKAMETAKAKSTGPVGAQAPAGSRIFTAEDFRRWGAQGGAKSKRTLSREQAKAMVAAREKKRRKTKRVTRNANHPLWSTQNLNGSAPSVAGSARPSPRASLPETCRRLQAPHRAGPPVSRREYRP